MPMLKHNTPDTLEDKSTQELVELYNSLAKPENRIKKFRDRATALRRVSETIATKKFSPASKTTPQEEEKPMSLLPGGSAKKQEHTPAPKPKAEKKKDRTISILVEVNPRREGTAGWHNFNLYRDGMTVAEYRAAGGASNHFNWDLKHGFISVE